jgi:hypothetical protein
LQEHALGQDGGTSTEIESARHRIVPLGQKLVTEYAAAQHQSGVEILTSEKNFCRMQPQALPAASYAIDPGLRDAVRIPTADISHRRPQYG